MPKDNVTNQQYTLPSGQVGYYSGPLSNAPGQAGSFAPTAITTAPSIPAPVVPPPKVSSVITPDLAQKDLAVKQSTANALSTAVQTQTQNNLARTGQLTGTASAGATPTTDLGAPKTPQELAQGTQPQSQTPAGATNPSASTTADILNLLNSGDVKLTPAQVQQIGGLNIQGVTQNPDGTYSVNNAAKSQLDQTNGFNPLTNTGDPITDFVNKSIADTQAKSDAAFTSYQNAVGQIINGTFPLTADQQQQVAGLQASFDQLRSLQTQANQNYVDAVTIAGIRAGRQQYAPSTQAGDVQAAISAGLTKIATIDTQAATAVATLKQGFLNTDYTMINDSYGKLQDALKAKDDAIAAMQKTVTDQVAASTAKIQNQTAQLALQASKMASLAPSTLQATLKLDGTIDLNELQQIADAQGVDVNALYAAVLKEKNTEELQQQAETKFASDQLQAAATLANTKATTAKTYADIATTQAAGSPAQNAAQLKSDAATSAQELLDMFNKGTGTTAVGKSNNLYGFGLDFIDQGTGRADFITKFNNLKSLLALDNVKYLKGQGQISDSERLLLSQAASALDRSQSEEAFKSTLETIIKNLGGSGTAGGSTGPVPKGTDGSSYGFPGYVSDGTQWVPK